MRRQIRFVIPAERAGGAVLDFLASRFTYHTRAEWVERMAEGRIAVNGRRADPEQALVAGDALAYDAADIPEPPMDDRITLVYCDEDLAVVNKSGNLTCHPGGRYFNHTLWALLKARHGIESPIFVNRIDRETSGIVLVARTPKAARNLRAQFAGRTVEKRYLALVEGTFPASCWAAGWIVADFTGEVLKKRRFVRVASPEPDATHPIQDAIGLRGRPPAGSDTTVYIGHGGRSSSTPDRARGARPSGSDQTVCIDEGRASSRAADAAPPEPDAQWALTAFRLLEQHGPISLIEACPHTGRLHQIRVALQTLGFPLVGDKMYGADPGIFLRFCKDALTREDLTRMRMKRQALHAAGLRFCHPRTGRTMAFDLPFPEDMQAVIQELDFPGKGKRLVRERTALS